MVRLYILLPKVESAKEFRLSTCISCTHLRQPLQERQERTLIPEEIVFGDQDLFYCLSHTPPPPHYYKADLQDIQWSIYKSIYDSLLEFR